MTIKLLESTMTRVHPKEYIEPNVQLQENEKGNHRSSAHKTLASGICLAAT
jgi:hypothetical protein